MEDTMFTVPNQKIISIGTIANGRKEKCDKDNLYLRVNKEAMLNAMKKLTATHFQMWLYLASQKEGYQFALFPIAVANETGMKKSSVQEAIRVLIKEKYLVQRDRSNIYDFYETAKDDEEEMFIVINKEIESNNGFIF